MRFFFSLTVSLTEYKNCFESFGRFFLVLFLIFLVGFTFSSCMYDSVGPTKAQREALRTELVIEVKNFSPQKKIFVQYNDSAGTHEINFAFGLKTSIAGSTIIGIDLAENTYSTLADVWVDENDNSIKDASEKKSCSAMSLSKQEPRALCTVTN